MRLTTPQISCIREGVVEYFGSTSHAWLFGSRLDDQLRGGDIDLYIEPETQNPVRLVDAKLKIFACNASPNWRSKNRCCVAAHCFSTGATDISNC